MESNNNQLNQLTQELATTLNMPEISLFKVCEGDPTYIFVNPDDETYEICDNSLPSQDDPEYSQIQECYAGDINYNGTTLPVFIY